MRLPVSERELQAQIREAAAYGGWLVYHTHDSRRSDPGFPDLVLVREGVMLALELKSEKGRMRPKQAAWVAAINEVYATYAAVLRPSTVTEPLLAAIANPTYTGRNWADLLKP